MKEFKYYLNKKDIKKSSKDTELAKSLIKDMLERIEKSNKLSTNEYSKIIFENMYDALRDFCDALLAINGYKSYSHSASISFLKNIGFNDNIINQMDLFRYKRK